jgi:hypothetical protein
MAGGIRRRQVYRGRELEVKKGKEWGQLDVSINGRSIGTMSGRTAEDAQKQLESLRAYVDDADARPDAYGPDYAPLPKYIKRSARPKA